MLSSEEFTDRGLNPAEGILHKCCGLRRTCRHIELDFGGGVFCNKA